MGGNFQREVGPKLVHVVNAADDESLKTWNGATERSERQGEQNGANGGGEPETSHRRWPNSPIRRTFSLLLKDINYVCKQLRYNLLPSRQDPHLLLIKL